MDYKGQGAMGGLTMKRFLLCAITFGIAFGASAQTISPAAFAPAATGAELDKVLGLPGKGALATIGGAEVSARYAALTTDPTYPANQDGLYLAIVQGGKAWAFKAKFSGYLSAARKVEELSGEGRTCIAVELQRNPGVATNGYDFTQLAYFLLAGGEVHYLADFFVRGTGYEVNIAARIEYQRVGERLFLVYHFSNSGDGLSTFGATALDCGRTLASPPTLAMVETSMVFSSYHGAPKGRILEDGVALRSLPSLSGPKLGSFRKGDPVRYEAAEPVFDVVGGKGGFWVRVKDEAGRAGWAWCEFVAGVE